MNVEPRTGVIVWCVTGPLNPRAGAHKDIGYYSAEAYEGLVRNTQKELKIGMRYWFMPRRCMLQWRHSGLVNFMSRTKKRHPNPHRRPAHRLKPLVPQDRERTEGN